MCKIEERDTMTNKWEGGRNNRREKRKKGKEKWSKMEDKRGRRK